MNATTGNPFATFWQAGDEGSDPINRAQTALSMNHSIGHLAHADEDDLLLQQFGIRAAAEFLAPFTDFPPHMPKVYGKHNDSLKTFI